MEAIRHLTMILSSGVGLQPSLTELDNRVYRILRTERKIVLKNSPLVKPYSQLYSFSKVIEVASAIARLKDCHAIEIRGSMKIRDLGTLLGTNLVKIVLMNGTEEFSKGKTLKITFIPNICLEKVR